jgi:hypothetical protein
MHKTVRGKVVEFSVQLEIRQQNKWRACIRYDTSHGFAHCDVIHVDGRKEKISLGTLDYNEALTFAQIDLDKNWQTHLQNFFKEAKCYEKE